MMWWVKTFLYYVDKLVCMTAKKIPRSDWANVDSVANREPRFEYRFISFVWTCRNSCEKYRWNYERELYNTYVWTDSNCEIASFRYIQLTGPLGGATTMGGVPIGIHIWMRSNRLLCPYLISVRLNAANWRPNRKNTSTPVPYGVWICHFSDICKRNLIEIGWVQQKPRRNRASGNGRKWIHSFWDSWQIERKKAEVSAKRENHLNEQIMCSIPFGLLWKFNYQHATQ